MSEELFKSFGVNIAKELNDALGPAFLPATLLSRSVGTPDPADLNAGAPITETPHSCRGIIDSYQARRFGGDTTIQEGTRVVLILGNSLPAGVVPEADDRVTIEGKTFHLTGPVLRDPASATYVCEVRA